MRISQEFITSERELDESGNPTTPHQSLAAEQFAASNRKKATGMRHEIILMDNNGFVRQHSMGASRAGAIQGFRAHGFTVEE